jgi:NAD-dependent SIR2 family protein deacetylase
MLNQNLIKILQDFVQSSKRITILTGAGISAESDIPTGDGDLQDVYAKTP